MPSLWRELVKFFFPKKANDDLKKAEDAVNKIYQLVKDNSTIKIKSNFKKALITFFCSKEP